MNSLGFRAVANPNITWYTVKTLNVGIDADLWNGLLGVSFDLFQRDRDNLMANRIATIPGHSVLQCLKRIWRVTVQKVLK